MEPLTSLLWAKQDQHEGDRWRLFRAVATAVDATDVLYPGSYVDVAPSFVFASVTYVDYDKRASRFFADKAGVLEIIASHTDAPPNPDFRFIHGDYSSDLGLEPCSFDLLVSLYAGHISRACTQCLRIGGKLLVNGSHGDAALASLDPRYRLVGVVQSRAGDYRVSATGLDGYLVPRSGSEPTTEELQRSGRGVAYTKSAFAYLFERLA